MEKMSKKWETDAKLQIIQVQHQADMDLEDKKCLHS